MPIALEFLFYYNDWRFCMFYFFSINYNCFTDTAMEKYTAKPRYYDTFGD